jgi:NAD(P)-dependent dehydrogenase (short-subunit alcohol dehydrogenase family)
LHLQLQSKRVLVIGGGSGIGFAVAQAAVAEGADVTIASTDPARLNTAAGRLGGAATACLDVTDERAVLAYFEAAANFDHIAFTAGDWGSSRRASFADIDIAAAQSLFRVRFWGAVTVAKYGARRLPPGGSLTLTGGMSAHRPQKGSAIATAMAGSVEHLTLGLAVELAPIRVNAVCPGAIKTEVWDRFPEHLREAELVRIRRQLLPRMGEAEEAAAAYLYLMCGGYTTGQVIFVEGGSALG